MASLASGRPHDSPGGGTRSRTWGRGVAHLRLATWPCRPTCLPAVGLVAPGRHAGELYRHATDALPPLPRSYPCGPRLWRRAAKVRTALLLKRSDELAALALGETADALGGAHVAALQEPCSLDGPVARQGPEQCHHLGRAKVLRGVGDQGGDVRSLPRLRSALSAPVAAHLSSVRQCLPALLHRPSGDFGGPCQWGGHGGSISERVRRHLVGRRGELQRLLKPQGCQMPVCRSGAGGVLNLGDRLLAWQAARRGRHHDRET